VKGRGGSGQTILLVEDDEQVRALLERVLRGRGYSVLRARDGREALGAVAQEGAAIDLLVTDLRMRPMGGFELADRVRALHPRVRVLYISGQPDHASLRLRAVPPGAMLLPKPFRPAELVASVRQLLDGPPGEVPA
jgi:DNA-binding response OmpR family regulator